MTAADPKTSPSLARRFPTPGDVEGGLNLGQVWQALRRNFLVVLGVTAATTAIAGVRVLTDDPIYSGSFSILAQSETTENAVIANIPETLTNIQSNTPTGVDDDLVKLLVSPKVLNPVVEKLKSDHPNICDPFPADGSPLELSNDPCYIGLVSQLAANPISQNSDIIQVSYNDESSQSVLTVLKLVAAAYLEFSLDSKQADIQKGITFVDEKLPDLRSKVATLQQELQTLRADYNLINPESRGAQLSSQVGIFSQQKRELVIQLDELRALESNLSFESSGELAASPALMQSSRYQKILDTILEVDAEMAEASTLYLDNSPDMEVLLERRDNLTALLSQEKNRVQIDLASQIREVEARGQSIDRTLQSLSGDVDELSDISRLYSDIQRELQVSTDNLKQFLTKREALQIDAAQKDIPWEIITPPATPTSTPVSLPQNLLLGGVAGFMLGAVIAILIEQLTGIVHSNEDIKRAVGLTILGKIPEDKTLNVLGTEAALLQSKMLQAENSQLVGANGDSTNGYRNRFSGFNGTLTEDPSQLAYYPSSLADAFQTIYSNFRLSNPKAAVRSVAVSSATPGEGKSTTAIYLAKAAADVGQKVLLVDADLRSPSIHKYLALSNAKGMTDIFAGTDSQSVTQELPSCHGLFVLTAGLGSSEATGFLSSSRMQEVVDHIGLEYDLVIFDTPPLIGMADASLIGSYVDGLIMVTCSGKLKRRQLEQAIEQLQTANIEVLGIVNRASSQD